jgi:hypothetical protein
MGSGEEDALARLMARIGAHTRPGAAELDEILAALLQLPPGRVDWPEVLELIAQHTHLSLVDAYRRIAADTSRPPASGLAWFYEAAARQLARRGHAVLLPEVAEAFHRLDGGVYNATALGFLQDVLAAADDDDLVLELAERFMPHMRADFDAGTLSQSLMDEHCQRMFWLRCGRVVSGGAGAGPAQTLAAGLIRGIPEDQVHDGLVLHVARELTHPSAHRSWTAQDLPLPGTGFDDGEGMVVGSPRLQTTLICIARQAWERDHVSPGATLLGLTWLADSAAREDEFDREEGKPGSSSLLDYLAAGSLEQRISDYCVRMKGIDRPRAWLLTRACELLLGFARGNQLLIAKQAAASAAVLERLATLLGD